MSSLAAAYFADRDTLGFHENDKQVYAVLSDISICLEKSQTFTGLCMLNTLNMLYALRADNLHRYAMENMSPEQADYVMRHSKVDHDTWMLTYQSDTSA